MFTLLFAVLIIYLSFTNYEILVSATMSSLSNLILLLIPSLFLMIILIRLLSSNKIILFCVDKLHIVLSKIFCFTSKSETFIFLFSLLNGNTTTAINISKSYQNDEITASQGERLVNHLCFSSPLYLYKTTLIYPPLVRTIIILSLYITPLIFLYFSNNKITKTSEMNIANSEPLFQIVENAFISLLKVFSFVLFFSMILSLIFNQFRIPDNFKFLIANTVELTVGGNYTITSPIYIEIFLCIFFNSFLGISLQCQIKSLAKFINFKRFFITRLIIAICAGLFGVLLFLNIYYILIILIFPIIKLILNKLSYKKSESILNNDPLN